MSIKLDETLNFGHYKEQCHCGAPLDDNFMCPSCDNEASAAYTTTSSFAEPGKCFCGANLDANGQCPSHGYGDDGRGYAAQSFQEVSSEYRI